MHGVGVKKGIEKSGAANIADHGDLIPRQVHGLQGLIQGSGDLLVGTSGAEYGGATFVEQANHARSPPRFAPA
jgi:hypothetical protein